MDKTPIGDLLADKAAYAVLAKDLPDLLAYKDIDKIKFMSLRAVEPFSQGALDDKKLAAIQKDGRCRKIGSDGGTAASALG